MARYEMPDDQRRALLDVDEVAVADPVLDELALMAMGAIPAEIPCPVVERQPPHLRDQS